MKWWPFGNGLTILHLPSKWELPFPVTRTIECPSCRKIYDMSDKIPGGVYQATVVCSSCRQFIEVVISKRGNMTSYRREKSYL